MIDKLSGRVLHIDFGKFTESTESSLWFDVVSNLVFLFSPGRRLL